MLTNKRSPDLPF